MNVEIYGGYPGARQGKQSSVCSLRSKDLGVVLSPRAQQLVAYLSGFGSTEEDMTDVGGSAHPTAGRMDSGAEGTEEVMPGPPAYSVEGDFERMDSVTTLVVDGTAGGPAAAVESVPLGTPVLLVLRYVDESALAVEDEEGVGT
ncbi:hypothetical protein MMC34_006722 [Xylographa carneopallida]|nr:hypothetical protein [Xylographa carneopallida]